MIIRCKACQSTVWIQAFESVGRSVSVSCRKCGQRYEFAGWTKTALTDRRVGVGARNLARDEEIDLPGAYSVLLGIMTAAEVRELQRAGHALDVPAADEPEAENAALSYDRAFKPAVDAGCLSPRQAKERGARDAYAAVLANQHGLPEQLAYEVADNRIPLLEAMRRRNASELNPLPVATRTRRPQRTLVLVAALAALVLTAALLNGSGESPVGAAIETSAGPAELLTDSEGRVLQVRAADPQAVLEAFCSAAGQGGRFTAVNVSVESAGSMLGLLRDSAKPSELLAIPIRENPEFDRWVAGSGRSPLIPDPAPPGVTIRAG